MKTLKEIQSNEEYLDEKLNLRTISGVVIVGKIRTIEKQIKSIKIFDVDGELRPQELDKKLNLLSTQLLFQSILTGSLQLLTKK
jgi:hypothetical protein|tara:strand:- start:79 stop:330 length:252 start_codon:yes stop_codon:yes gene_type:complete